MRCMPMVPKMFIMGLYIYPRTHYRYLSQPIIRLVWSSKCCLRLRIKPTSELNRYVLSNDYLRGFVLDLDLNKLLLASC